MSTRPTESRTRPPSLWRHKGFLGLWGAESISEFGSQFSSLALPVIAVTLLHAGEWQLGVLNASAVVRRLPGP